MTKNSLKFKFGLGLAILLLLVLTLAVTSVVTMGHFRRVVFDLSRRAQELPAAGELSAGIAQLRRTVGEIKGSRLAEERVKTRLEERQTSREIIKRLELFDFSRPHDLTAYSLFLKMVDDYAESLVRYEALVLSRPNQGKLFERPKTEGADDELAAIAEIRERLDEMRPLIEDIRWPTDETMIDRIDAQLLELTKITDRLPSGLYRELSGFSDRVRSQYGAIRLIAFAAGFAAALLLVLLLRLAYIWIFRPLQTLVSGSRRVASGDFGFRIELDSNDEFSELAQALNQMTERFEDIRDDLDVQVKKRSEEVLRGERLASVGFLAAGVAHEINNPLASIAMSAESLARRLPALFEPSKTADETNRERAVAEKYVGMIQTEAFRCKNITEKLLDFSRSGGGRMEPTDLTELIGGMVEMIQTQTRYRDRRIETITDRPVMAVVNPQEIKQVVLNLLTNALDSTDEHGRVRISVERAGQRVLLTVEDDGCGMEPETLANIFEPFYTKKEPGRGTGLGLAITQRIVAGHHGKITAASRGTGKGAAFRVELPAELADKNREKQWQNRA